MTKERAKELQEMGEEIIYLLELRKQDVILAVEAYQDENKLEDPEALYIKNWILKKLDLKF